MALKPVTWLGTALSTVREFPDDARQDVGYQLYRVQQGLEPSSWKPMPAVGAGVLELRIHAGGAFRILYVTKYDEAIYVLHAFQKKTQKARKADLALAQQRLVALLAERRQGSRERSRD